MQTLQPDAPFWASADKSIARMWHDVQFMKLMVSDFYSRRDVDPEDWDSRLDFWKRVVQAICSSISPSELCWAYVKREVRWRKAEPLGLSIVVDDLIRSSKMVSCSIFCSDPVANVKHFIAGTSRLGEEAAQLSAESRVSRMRGWVGSTWNRFQSTVLGSDHKEQQTEIERFTFSDAGVSEADNLVHMSVLSDVAEAVHQELAHISTDYMDNVWPMKMLLQWMRGTGMQALSQSKLAAQSEFLLKWRQTRILLIFMDVTGLLVPIYADSSVVAKQACVPPEEWIGVTVNSTANVDQLPSSTDEQEDASHRSAVRKVNQALVTIRSSLDMMKHREEDLESQAEKWNVKVHSYLQGKDRTSALYALKERNRKQKELTSLRSKMHNVDVVLDKLRQALIDLSYVQSLHLGSSALSSTTVSLDKISALEEQVLSALESVQESEDAMSDLSDAIQSVSLLNAGGNIDAEISDELDALESEIAAAKKSESSSATAIPEQQAATGTSSETAVEEPVVDRPESSPTPQSSKQPNDACASTTVAETASEEEDAQLVAA